MEGKYSVFWGKHLKLKTTKTVNASSVWKLSFAWIQRQTGMSEECGTILFEAEIFIPVHAYVILFKIIVLLFVII